MQRLHDETKLEKLWETAVAGKSINSYYRKPQIITEDVTEIIEEKSVLDRIFQVDERGKPLTPRTAPKNNPEKIEQAAALKAQVAFVHNDPEINLKADAKLIRWVENDVKGSRNKLSVIQHLKQGDGALIVYHDGPRERILIHQRYGSAGMEPDIPQRRVGVGKDHYQFIWIFYRDGRIESRRRATSGSNKVFDPTFRHARGGQGVPHANISVDYIDPDRRKSIYIIKMKDFQPTDATVDINGKITKVVDTITSLVKRPVYSQDQDTIAAARRALTHRFGMAGVVLHGAPEPVKGLNISPQLRRHLLNNIDEVTDIVSQELYKFNRMPGDGHLWATNLRRGTPLRRLTRILTLLQQGSQSTSIVDEINRRYGPLIKRWVQKAVDVMSTTWNMRIARGASPEDIARDMEQFQRMVAMITNPAYDYKSEITEFFRDSRYSQEQFTLFTSKEEETQALQDLVAFITKPARDIIHNSSTSTASEVPTFGLDDSDDDLI